MSLPETTLQWLEDVACRDEDVTLGDHHEVVILDLLVSPGQVPLPQGLSHAVACRGLVNRNWGEEATFIVWPSQSRE